MSVTYGFYDSLNGDRKYNATQLSSIFDGIIGDGVFATIGSAFAVTATTGLTVNVGIGKAWFNHTWTNNDAILPLTAPDSELLLDRIDAIVLEVNSSVGVRQNSIKFVTGTAASSPVNPAMTKSDGVYQYPLCYIYRKAGSTEITQSNITTAIGTDETPFITGILETVSLEEHLGKWSDELDSFITNGQTEFEAWFAEVKDTLSTDAAGNLQKQVTNLKTNKQNLMSVLNDIPVPVSSWVTDSTYTQYPYRAAITNSIITATTYADVIFSPTDVLTRLYAPVNQTYDGGIYIYAKKIPSDVITIPTIALWPTTTEG